MMSVGQSSSTHPMSLILLHCPALHALFMKFCGSYSWFALTYCFNCPLKLILLFVKRGKYILPFGKPSGITLGSMGKEVHPIIDLIITDM